MMTRSRLKTWFFIIEGINSASTTLFFYYLFFYVKEQFGSGPVSNLWLSALNGFVYTFAAWNGGKVALKKGPFYALRLGFILVIAALLFGGLFASNMTGICVTIVFWSIGICFTWPTLESLVCENESPAGLPRMIGLYNVVWAGTSAIAYFAGGAMLKYLGMKSMFFIPAGMHLFQLVLLGWLQKQHDAMPLIAPAAQVVAAVKSGEEIPIKRQVNPRAFMLMAWVANPFAYMAINSVIPVIPDLATKLNLSLVFTGFFCSIWFFARMGAFVLFWLWPGWHYRFRWLIGSYTVMIGCFLALLLVPNLWVLIVAQTLFGLTVGLAYYSSLYYSMDVGAGQSDHGGFHEAAIGVGVFLGPALGASALQFFPEKANAGAWAVGVLLLIGMAAMIGIKIRSRKSSS
jgi:MFS family permease